MNRIWSPGLLLLLAVAVGGCLNLEPRGNPTAFYVLGGAWEEAPQRTTGEVTGLSVGLHGLELASYLETPRMVVRKGTHGVRFAEFHRWGEALDRGINRSVAGYLAARPGVARVDVVPWPRWARHDYAVHLRVLRFEGVAPEAAAEGAPADGAAHLLATWEIVAVDDGAVVTSGTTDVRQEGWAVDDYDALAALLDAALERVAADIGAGLETL